MHKSWEGLLLEPCLSLFASAPLQKPIALTLYKTCGYWIYNIRHSTAQQCYLYHQFEFQRKLYSLVSVMIHREHLMAAPLPSNRRGNWQTGRNGFEWDGQVDKQKNTFFASDGIFCYDFCLMMTLPCAHCWKGNDRKQYNENPNTNFLKCFSHLKINFYPSSSVQEINTFFFSDWAQ